MDLIRLSALLLLMAVLQCNAACDVQTLLSECSAIIQQLSNLPEYPTPDDIKAACGHVAVYEKCLQKYEPTCSGDKTYQGLVQSKGSYTAMCSGGGGVCPVWQCALALRPITEPETDPQDFGLDIIRQSCMNYESFKQCVAAYDLSQCAKPQVDAINMIKANLTAICKGECAVRHILECYKDMDMKTLQGIKGFITSAQLTAVCKNADKQITCVGNYIKKCPVKKKDDLTSQMNIYRGMLTIICQESKQVIMDYQECFANDDVQAQGESCTNTDAATSLRLIVEGNKQEFCRQKEAERKCLTQIVEKRCSKEATRAFDKIYIKLNAAQSEIGLDCNIE